MFVPLKGGYSLTIKAVTGKTLKIEVDPDSSINNLKEAIEKATSIPAKDQRLMYAAETVIHLDDNRTLRDHGIQSGKSGELLKL